MSPPPQQSQALQQRHEPRKALIWILCSGFCFSLMAAFVKELTPRIPEVEIIFFRAVIGLVSTVVVLSFFPEVEWIPKKGKKLLFFRGLAGTAGLACYFYSLRTLPISIAVLLLHLSPIFVVFFSWLFLRERYRLEVLLWIGITILGLGVVVLPPDSDWGSGLSDGGTVLSWVGLGIGTLSGIFAAAAYVSTRAATAHFSAFVIILYFTLTTLVLTAPFMLTQFVMPTPREWVLLFTAGSVASLAQFALTNGYRLAPAGLVSTMGLTSIGFAGLWGWLFYGEGLSTLQFLGLGLLICGVAMVTLRSRRT